MAIVDCNFVEPDLDKPLGGNTPKFECEFTIKNKKQNIRVKYDPASVWIDGKKGGRNLEVWGEVLSTRLLWALGFAADRIYPLTVRCHNCPLEPWTYIRETLNRVKAEDRISGLVRTDLLNNPRLKERDTRTFFPAVIEFKYDASKIESLHDSGWAWAEIYEHMDNPSEQKIHRDALSILAAFLNHADNKPSQQRLVCRDKSSVKDGKCAKPLLMIQDAGATFGNGWAPLQGDFTLSKVDMKKWSDLSLWADKKSCKVKINGFITGSLRSSQTVSEEARVFVAGLFRKLSRQQILDMFSAAKIDALGAASSEEWTKAFLAKVQRDLYDSKCGL
jgi:hypothetical protein